MSLFITVEVPTDRIATFGLLCNRVGVGAPVACGPTLADLMNAIEDEEIRRFKAKHAGVQAAIDAAMQDEVKPVVVGG